MTPSLPAPAPVPARGLFATELGTSGELIVFCHGLFGQGKNWTSVAKSLSGDYRCLLVDLPNHGRSEWTDSLSYQQMATAVADRLAEHAGGEQISLVGHSMGGKVAMTLALLRPQLVRRLCVVDIAPVAYPALSSFAPYVHGMRSLPLDQLPDRPTADRLLEPYVADPTVRSFLLQNLRREASAWRWQQNLGLLGDHLDDLAGWPELDADPYPGPTLWVAGADSDYITPEHAAAMRAQFPKAQLLTVKHAGHWVHAEQPQVFVGALRRFMARGASAAGCRTNFQ